MLAGRKTTRRLAILHGILAAIFFFFVPALRAQDYDNARKLLITGKYKECIDACERALTDRDEWHMLRAEALMQIGRYPEAELVVSNALTEWPSSLRLRVLGFDTANAAGKPNLARVRLGQINDLVSSRPWAYRDTPDIVALGHAALLMGADPKIVLDRFLSTAQKSDPNFRETYLEGGQLALSKNDFALAAKKFSEALKKFPDDPDMLYGLARAYESSDRAQMLESLETALEKNDNHVPSLLLLTDHLVDAEEYREAEKLIERALKVNPWRPEAWAYRAVIAHLRNDTKGETEARKKALKYWDSNSLVDHLIGKKLSQNYRFSEGSTYQRQALESDADYLPAQIQLAEDLLRLGDEREGWQLATQVNKKDGYDVTAYNLVTLHGTMQKFQTISNENFILRMSAKEAALYGDRALALLERARSNLVQKYGIKLERATTVEIFPEQKDFGVRTFGMPHNPGFLGVCFGRVITANSPASAGGTPSNWEAMLWHEFCHVITLQLTKNKMPRWLSEGISVYEELQANPTWGQRMNPRYREMILGEDLTPVSKLSAAFLSPKSEMHVQFAYYESSQVVQFLVERYGFEKLKAILGDLGNGVAINDAIPKHTAPIATVEKEFAQFIKAKAEALAPGLDFKEPKRNNRRNARADDGMDVQDIVDRLSDLINETASATNSAHTNSLTLQHPLVPTNVPTPVVAAPKSDNSTNQPAKPNYWKMLEEARRLIARKDWSPAKTLLLNLVEQYPAQAGEGNGLDLLATVHRNLNETNAEHAVLTKLAALDDAAPEAYLRLIQLGEAAKDWKEIAVNAERFLAVNPLIAQPYRSLARASEETGDRNSAINACQKLLLLDPPDPADLHFRLARLMRLNNDPAAKRQVLEALEEAPRFREAHALLLELAKSDPASTNAPPAPKNK